MQYHFFQFISLHAGCFILSVEFSFNIENTQDYDPTLNCYIVYGVLQVFLRSVGHPYSPWSTEWTGSSSSVTVVLWALS